MTDTSIVTTHYRYKRPPRKRKPVALEVPAVVTAKSSRRTPPVGGKGEVAAESYVRPFPDEEGTAQPSTPREAARVISPPHHSASPATDDGKPAMATKSVIVTTGRKRRSEADRPHLPMELPLSRKPVERDGDDYKRLKAAMARRLRGE